MRRIVSEVIGLVHGHARNREPAAAVCDRTGGQTAVFESEFDEGKCVWVWFNWSSDMSPGQVCTISEREQDTVTSEYKDERNSVRRTYVRSLGLLTSWSASIKAISCWG